MRLRSETAADLDAIRTVHDAAFGREDESRIVDDVRATAEFLPELSLVAEVGGRVVGHVLLSRLRLGEHEVLLLGPLGVLPERQRHGIGSALVLEGLRRAEAAGESLVLLEGDPRYYSRFGFRLAAELGIEAPDGVPARFFQARTLAAYTPDVRGPAVYPPAFRE